jgi:hypothetical protein
MTFKRTYERWGLKDGEKKLRIEGNSTGGQGSRRAVAPSDDDEGGLRPTLRYYLSVSSSGVKLRGQALEDGTDMQSRNVGFEPLYAA